MTTTIRSSTPRDTRARDVDTLVIGAGQAGLATAHYLRRWGRDVVVVDAERRVGDNWRHQYDSLRLFTPNRYNGLPGMAFPGAAWDFPDKDEVGDFLESYADRFQLPVRLESRVQRLVRHRDGFRIETTRGVFHANNVVIATGTFGRVPSVPGFARELDDSILQLHSSQYRRTGQLHDGPVLVVGAGHSGCDIALEVAGTHPTTLAGRDPGQIPVPWDSPLLRIALPIVLFTHKYIHTRSSRIGRREFEQVRLHGGPMLRVKRRDLAEAGVVRTTQRVVGARDGLPQLADGTVVDAANVVWATGFRHDFSWLDLPVVSDGWPRETRGVATDVEGLFFCGLSYQHSMASMNFYGVGRDAAYIVRRILARRPTQTPVGGPV